MKTTFSSVTRYLTAKNLIPMALANLICTVPFAAALVLPLTWPDQREWGFGSLILGFLLTGLVVAISGRWLDGNHWSRPAQRQALWQVVKKSWAEGLALAALFLGFFSLVFQSLPFYWAQGGWMSVVSLVTLSLGMLLVLLSAPFFLPVRRRERLGILKAAFRSYNLAKKRPLFSVGILIAGLGSAVASGVTLGVFPGFVGLAAVHQGAYDHLVRGPESALDHPGSVG